MTFTLTDDAMGSQTQTLSSSVGSGLFKVPSNTIYKGQGKGQRPLSADSQIQGKWTQHGQSRGRRQVDEDYEAQVVCKRERKWLFVIAFKCLGADAEMLIESGPQTGTGQLWGGPICPRLTGKMRTLFNIGSS